MDIIETCVFCGKTKNPGLLVALVINFTWAVIALIVIAADVWTKRKQYKRSQR